jgi:flagellin
LHSSSLVTSVARGRIEDTSYAAETARLAKQQILEQVGTALLAQANMDAKSVLKLLSAN